MIEHRPAAAAPRTRLERAKVGWLLTALTPVSVSLSAIIPEVDQND
jgi:hypothetical protein